MKREVQMRFLQLSLFLLFVFLAAPAYPHGGGLDAYGCHHNRKAGGYHCHCGQFTGESFSSKEEMLKKLASEKTEPAKKSKVKE
jgi:hypothetical protein